MLSAVGAPGSASSRSSAHVLVVDDELMILDTLKRRLERSGHTVVCASSAADARAVIARDATFDLVVSDVTMPGTSGVQLHAELAVTHPDVAARVVFITGGIQDADAARYLASIPNKLLQKPIPMNELLELIADARARHPAT